MEENNDTKIRTVKELLCKLIDDKAWDQAIVIGEYLATLDPEGVLAYQALGYAALNLNNTDKCEQYFHKAIERGDCDPMTFIQLARMHSFKNDLNGKIFWLKKALEQDPDNVVALHNLGLTHQSLGENDIAEEYFRQIVEKHPENIDAWTALSDIHLSEQRLDAAEEDLRNAITLNGNIGQLHALLAWVLKEQEQYDDALAEYFLAFDLEPDNPVRYYDIGDTFLAMKDYDRAIIFLGRASEMDPSNPLYYYDLGLAFFNIGEYRACERANQMALRSDSRMMSARTNLGLNVTTNLGLAYLNQGKLADAEQCFRQNLELTASSHFNLGLALHWQGRYDEALNQFLHAVELVPDDAPYLDMAGNAWLEQNNLEKAREAFEKSISVDPEYPPAQYDLGVVFSRQKGMEKKAMDQFMKAISLDEAYPLPYYAVACLLALEGKKDMALENLKKAVERGFTNRVHADSDHDLDALRDDPEFREIMKMMDERKAAQTKEPAPTPEKSPKKPEPEVPAKKPEKQGAGSSKASGNLDPEVMRYIW